jgi:hypothetical protein
MRPPPQGLPLQSVSRSSSPEYGSASDLNRSAGRESKFWSFWRTWPVFAGGAIAGISSWDARQQGLFNYQKPSPRFEVETALWLHQEQEHYKFLAQAVEMWRVVDLP